MDGFTCAEIKTVVFQLMQEESLTGKIFVAGGIVPWIVSSRDSGRKHVDIDIVVAIENMQLVRSYLKNKGLYDKKHDSMFLEFNRKIDDYGLEVFINGIPVNFAPFEQNGNDIIQKNFSVEDLSGFNALMKATMKDIALEDYVTQASLGNGLSIGMYTLEMVKSAKERSGREKDVHDLRETDRIGVDINRYNRVFPAVKNMVIDFIPG